MHRPTFHVLAGTLVTLLVSLAISAPTVIAQVTFASPSPAEGTPSRAFEFFPSDSGFGSYLEPTISAGEGANLKVTIFNTGEVPQQIRTYAVNAFTAIGGGFAAADYGSPTGEVTSWLEFPNQVHTLESKTGVELQFAISVPSNTAPGQYITAVAAEHADPSHIEGTDNLLQSTRYVVPVFITVPGETTSGFEVGEISIGTDSGAVIIDVHLENTGDVRVRPEGTISIVDAEGNRAVSIPVNMESIYAHDETVLTVGTTEVLPPGDYTVKVDLSDKETKTTASGESDQTRIDLAATPVPVTISIGSSSVEPGPDADNVQFAIVEASITNSGDPVANAQLSLLAFKDGEEIERFPISQSLSLQPGETPITTRYIPLEGWSQGEWTFELLLETVEGNGAAVVVASQPIEGRITIP